MLSRVPHTVHLCEEMTRVQFLHKVTELSTNKQHTLSLALVQPIVLVTNGYEGEFMDDLRTGSGSWSSCEVYEANLLTVSPTDKGTSSPRTRIGQSKQFPEWVRFPIFPGPVPVLSYDRGNNTCTCNNTCPVQ
jgi:hypothetical protein